MSIVDGGFALVLLLFAAVGGGLMAKLAGMPPLLGMLIAGVTLRNLPGQLLDGLPESWSVLIRLVALTVILLRAGLGLDLDALRRLKGPFLRLAILPNLSEALSVAAIAMVLFSMPPAWGLLLGFVIAAVSPAVVVPSLIELQAKGFGVAKGIPTMVLAAASFDDVLSIAGFGVAVSFVFAGAGESGVLESVLRVPGEVGFGLGAGLGAGLLCGGIGRGPVWIRLGVLAAFGLTAVIGGWAVGFTGGGGMATMTMGAVAARVWRHEADPVSFALSRVWGLAQPILFGLIGAAVVLSTVESSHVVKGLMILMIGLVVRLLVTYLSTASSGFTYQERFFVALAWIPKATVQAAIGALALDLAREYGAGVSAETYGTQVLTVAVLAIVVTAPIGALAIAWSGPRWLERE